MGVEKVRNDKIVAFLPCRKGSQRVIKKNTRRFANEEYGLISIKINQLISCKEIDEIVVSTDDDDVKKVCESALKDSNKLYKILDRPSNLAKSTTSTDEVIRHVMDCISEGVVLWTHVTSPFVDETVYSLAIQTYLNNKDMYDSLMSVTKIQKFLWNTEHPINYDRNVEKWPRTQTLPVIYEVNSAIFIADIEIYKRYQDRIGQKPYLFELNWLQSFDIDWEEDFIIAEKLWEMKG